VFCSTVSEWLVLSQFETAKDVEAQKQGLISIFDEWIDNPFGIVVDIGIVVLCREYRWQLAGQSYCSLERLVKQS
jgi:hypothetical protein